MKALKLEITVQWDRHWTGMEGFKQLMADRLSQIVGGCSYTTVEGYSTESSRCEISGVFTVLLLEGVRQYSQRTSIYDMVEGLQTALNSCVLITEQEITKATFVGLE